MNMPALSDLMPLAADFVLLSGALWLLVLDLLLPHGDKRLLAGGAAATLLAAFATTFAFDGLGPVWGGAYLGTGLAVFFKRVFFVAGALAVLGARDHAIRAYTRRQGELYFLMLCSVLGMSLLAGARDLVLLSVAFELMGIPLYLLAAWSVAERRAVEGALKLYLVGALSSGVMLFGLSLLFGLASSSSLDAVAAHVAAQPSPLALIGVAFALAGAGFKIGVAPFHMWLPDTYEGAATPFVAFLAAAPKVAGIAVLVQLLHGGGSALATLAAPVLIGLAILTVVVGNLFAIQQTNVKRLLAFSGVAHVGFLLFALATRSEQGLAMLLFYGAGYVFTNIGALLVVHAVQVGGGDIEDPDSVRSFDGLMQRNGWLAMAMLTFLLSLAGIPFVVGFWAKLFVFLAMWMAGFYGLVVFGAALSVLALFYYLRVARAMFMNAASVPARIEVSPSTNVAIALCFAAVVGLGLMPGPLLEAAEAAAASFWAP